jgi:hypothetical protein
VDPDAALHDLDRRHLDPEPDLESVGHRTHQGPVAVHRQVAEQVTLVLLLAREPVERHPFGEVGGVGLQHGAHGLASPARVRARHPGIGHQRLHRLPARAIRSEPGTHVLDHGGELLQRQREQPIHLVLIQAPALGDVVRRDRRQRVARVAGDADLVSERPHRVADRVVNPRAAEVHRRTGEVDRVQPTADPVTCLQHHAVDTLVSQGGRHGQP